MIACGKGMARRAALIKSLRAFATIALVLCASVSLAADQESKAYKSGAYEFQLAPAPAWVDVHDVAREWDAAAPGASGARWRNWLWDSQVDRRSGTRERYFDRAYEAVSPELVQDAGKHQIWFSPDYQRLILHRVELRRDGTWHDRLLPNAITLARRESEFENDMSNGIVSALIVLDDVRIGDVVRVSYTISGDNPVLGGLVDEEFMFGATDPVLDRRASVLFDAGARIDEHRDRGAPDSRRHSDKRGLEWAAEEHGLAGIVDESSYPIWYDVAPVLVVGTHHTWADIATWAESLYPAPKPLPADLEQRLVEWRALGTPEKRLAAALRAVQEDVRYFGTELGESTHRPSEPADTWSRRYGDCKDKARLLSTLLGRLGIQANPALVSASRGKSVFDLPPAASLFDHVIVQAMIGDQSLWLDATMTQQRGLPSTRVPGDFGFALPVGAGRRDLMKVAPPVAATDKMRVTEHILPSTATPSARLSVETELEGSAADRMRRRLKLEGPEALQRIYLDFYRKRYGDVDPETALSVDDDEEKDKLRISERYLMKNPWIGSATQKAVEVYADAIASELALPKTAQRRAPLAIAYPSDVEQRVELELPAGWHWLGQPQQRKLEDAAVTFEFDTRQTNRTVSVIQQLRTRQSVVGPEDYPKHFSLLRDANELFSRRLLVEIPARDAEYQRDKRLQDLMRNILDDKHGKSEQKND
jgi:Domain of Unknown Function with PDB structure (DUF3857)/Domain of Unknown Function with PDB structure (DUF3858)